MTEAPRRLPPPRRLAVAALLVLLLAITAALALRPWAGPGAPQAAAPAAFHSRDVSPENWKGAFTLTDMDGRTRTLEEFRGKVVLLSFGYTHCPDVCPTTLARFAQVRRLLGKDADHVQGLFITIDPERDTAALLRSYVPAFDPSFIGLRGSEAQTDAVTSAYHANYQIVDTKTERLVDHTASTYVIDPASRVRLVSAYDQTAEDLAQDVRALLAGS